MRCQRNKVKFALLAGIWYTDPTRGKCMFSVSLSGSRLLKSWPNWKEVQKEKYTYIGSHMIRSLRHLNTCKKKKKRQMKQKRGLGPILDHCHLFYKETALFLSWRKRLSDWLALSLFLQKSYKKTVTDKWENKKKKNQRLRISNKNRIQHMQKWVGDKGYSLTKTDLSLL